MEELAIDYSTLPGLREYYYVHILMLSNTCDEFEDTLDQKLEEIVKKFLENGSSDKTRLEKNHHYYSKQLSTQLRYAMLPRFLGVFEFIVKKICKIEGFDLKASSVKGSWFEKHVAFLQEKQCSFGDVSIKLEEMQNLIEIRNCIVHANGEIAACKKPKRIEEAIKYFKLNNEPDVAAIFQEGLLQLKIQAIPITREAIRQIFEVIFKHFKCPLDMQRYY